jgi:hypothetical protein
MLSIPKSLEEKKYIPLREFISDVVMSRGNQRFLLTNLQAQIWGVTGPTIIIILILEFYFRLILFS